MCSAKRKSGQQPRLIVQTSSGKKFLIKHAELAGNRWLVKEIRDRPRMKRTGKTTQTKTKKGRRNKEK